MTVDSVLIGGAGIAGPVVASLLAEQGVRVTVVEVAGGVRPGGQVPETGSRLAGMNTATVAAATTRPAPIHC